MALVRTAGEVGVRVQEYALENTPMELTKIMDGGCVYGEFRARSTKFRAPWMSTSKDAMDMLKLTFQAEDTHHASVHMVIVEYVCKCKSHH